MNSTHANVETDETVAKVRDYFDSTTVYWDTVYEGNAFIHHHMNDRMRMVLAAVDEVSQRAQLRILDLGCGTGIVTQRLLQKGHRVAAVDCSAKMLAELRRSVGSYLFKQCVGAIQADVNYTPFRNDEFDLVLCVGVIQYQHNEDLVLSEISRVLRPKGHCIFTLPNLLTIAHLTDPIYVLRFIRRLLTRSLLGTELCSGESGVFKFLGEYGDAEPYNRKFVKPEVSRILRRHRLELRRETGYGFGPLTIITKAFLPERLSIGLSNTITSVSRCPGMRWFSYFANRWVFIAQKV